MKLNTAKEGAEKAYDFIVIGGGSAGATLAARLAEDASVTVALVEAGTHATELEAKMPVACGKMQNSERDWAFRSEPSKVAFKDFVGQVSSWPRGKCLGGCSVLNYMAYVRGARRDFDTWRDDFGAKGWGWEDLLPLFTKSEDFLSPGHADVEAKVHGTGGPLGVSVSTAVSGISHAFVDGCVQLGYARGDYNNGKMERVVSLFQQTIRHGARSDTYTAFIASQARKQSNLTIVTHAQATKVLLETGADGSKKAVGVEVGDLSDKARTRYTLRAKREVIVSCGAIQSPHLMMLSGMGPRAELERAGVPVLVDLPGVGQNLEDHMATPIRFVPQPGVVLPGLANQKSAERMPYALPSLLRWAFYGTGLHASSSYDSTCFFKTKPFEASHPAYGPDAQIGLFCSPGDETMIKNMNIRPEKNYSKPFYESGNGFIMVPTLLHSHSRGRIELVSKDPFAHPRIYDGFLTDARDVTALAEIVRECFRLAKTPAMQEAGTGEPAFPEEMVQRHKGDINSHAFLEEYLRGTANTLYHPTSTCKIGTVVDARLRVKGVQGLRIADASVMPTIISGNTNAPSIVIGEKAAAMIKEDHGMTDTVVLSAPAPNRLPQYVLPLGVITMVVAVAAVVM